MVILACHPVYIKCIEKKIVLKELSTLDDSMKTFHDPTLLRPVLNSYGPELSESVESLVYKVAKR